MFFELLFQHCVIRISYIDERTSKLGTLYNILKMAPDKRKQGRGRRLTGEEKLEIIEKWEDQKMKKAHLARDYGVSETCIRNTIRDKDDIKRRLGTVCESVLKRQRRISLGKFPQVETVLYEWLYACRMKEMVVPRCMLLFKAKQIAKDLGVESFKGSSGWLTNFLNRKGIVSTKLFGEGGEVDKNDPVLQQKLRELEELLCEYEYEHIYNMDETGLFYRVVPRHTTLLPSENKNTTRGKKAQKERVTAAVCCNATGSHKVDLFLIGKPKEPACIKTVRGKVWPIPYTHQKNAWMDSCTFAMWFDEVFLPSVRLRTRRPVLLLLDNAPSHPKEFTRLNVTVKFLPPNVTSWKQPMDMGIIAALKKRYKHILCKEILTFHDLPPIVKEERKEEASRLRRGAAGVFYGRHPTLLDAATYCKEAWKQISETTIANCFRKADIIQELDVQDDPDQDDGNELALLLKNCTLFEDIDKQTIANEIEAVLKMDEDDSEEMQQARLEDIEEILDNPGLQLNDESISENSQSDDDDLVSYDDLDSYDGSDFNIDTLLSAAHALNKELRKYNGNLKKDFDECSDSIRDLEHKLQHFNFAILRENQEKSKQMSILDFFNH